MDRCYLNGCDSEGLPVSGVRLCVCVWARLIACVRVPAWLRACVCVHACVCVCVWHTNMHYHLPILITYAHALQHGFTSHTRIHIHKHACVHTYTVSIQSVCKHTHSHIHTHICTHSIDTHHHIGCVHTQAHICTHTILTPTHHSYPEAYIITIMCMHTQTTISSEAFYLLAHDSNRHQLSKTHFHICNVFYSV